mmetsp:Transcript_35329/g.92734  ORF Transcript_35329/g.92734 Transcript_35329/m.92734 type:complete len:223 (+) Transcript_35329:58-726(+)
MSDIRNCLRAFVHFLCGVGFVGVLGYTAVLSMNYENDLSRYDASQAAIKTFQEIQGGCMRTLRTSLVVEDCYSCYSQCSGTPSCYCETNDIYNVSVVNMVPGLLSGSAYTSESLAGPRNSVGTCTVTSAAPPEAVSCWYSDDPTTAARALPCGSPQCIKLSDPFAAVVAAPEDERGLWYGITATMFVLAFFTVGPCCFPSLFMKCGVTYCVDDETKSASVRA